MNQTEYTQEIEALSALISGEEDEEVFATAKDIIVVQIELKCIYNCEEDLLINRNPPA